MKRVINYIPTVLVAGLIMYLSLMREPHFNIDMSHIPHFDKVVHGLMYLGLSLILSLDLKRDNLNIGLVALITIVLSSVYGGVIELLQEYYFPPRTGEWLDWAADIAGAVLGFALCTFYFLSMKSKKTDG